MTRSKVRVCLLSWLAICGLAGTGCGFLLGKEPNPDYCASPPCSPPDTGGCTSNADCMASSASVCDLTAKQCVQCTVADQAACTGTAPVCGINNACRACAAHGECASNACSLGDGSCAAETNVAYVDSTGTDNPTCGRMTPCASVAAALATKQPYIKLTGTIDGEVVIQGGRPVTLLADPGAMLTRTGGNILTVKDAGTSAAIYDLTISGASGAGVGVSVEGGGALSLTNATISSNAGGGISVSGGSIQLTRSMIRGNLGGGVNITGGAAKFSIVSNVFVANGSATSSTGAVYIQSASSSGNLLEFNTFYHNLSANKAGSAIQCTSPMSPIFTARANIMFNNGIAGNSDQTSGTCMHAYSLASPGTLPPDMNNQSNDPMFMNADGGDFHLRPESPAVGAANALIPLADLDRQDFAGQPRVMSPVNIGALQPKPQ